MLFVFSISSHNFCRVLDFYIYISAVGCVRALRAPLEILVHFSAILVSLLNDDDDNNNDDDDDDDDDDNTLRKCYDTMYIFIG